MKLKDPQVYSDPEMRMKRFSRIKSEEAKVLLDKVRNATFSNEKATNNSSLYAKESTIELNTKLLTSFSNLR